MYGARYVINTAYKKLPFESVGSPLKNSYNLKEVVYVVAKRKPLGRKGKNSVYVSGYTTDNKPVVCNVFYQSETNGIPLDILIETLYNSGYVIDWITFINDALNVKWKKETIFKKIKYAFDDIDIENKENTLDKISTYLDL